MKLLYVGEEIKKVDSGAAQVNKRNIAVLKELFGAELDYIAPVNKKLAFLVWGTDKNFLGVLLEKIRRNSYDYVFLSQSLYGVVAEVIKKHSPLVKIICFFHNIERHYAKEYVRSSGWKHLPFYYASKRAERLAVENSDYYIVLNERDASLLNKMYRKQADLILPTSFKDHFQYDKSCMTNSCTAEISYLFVGVAFFANVEGIKWFIKNVLPSIPGKLIVVGKGMDDALGNFASERVQIKGYVEDLAEYYYKASFVVLPIFSGGGMKTKTAEALMYGKTILGTTEAFEGYHLVPNATIVCNSAQQFVDNILRLIEKGKGMPYNLNSRHLFEERYSFEASVRLVSNFFRQIESTLK